MFKAASYDYFWDILVTSFQCPNLQRATTKNRVILYYFSPNYLLIILYQLTKFEATSCKKKWDILITSIQCQNLQMAITRKKTFKKMHKVLCLASSVNWPCLKLLAIIMFEISWLKVFNAQICKGQWLQKDFFLNFHQAIYLVSSISWSSVKLLAVIFFEIFRLQVLNAKTCKGQ